MDDEETIKQILTSALPTDPPPSTLDRATLTRRGRQALRRRRLAASGGALAAVVVVAAAGTAAYGGLPPDHRVTPAGPPSAATASTSTSPSTSPPPTPPAPSRSAESQSAAITRLNAALRPVMLRYLSGAKLTGNGWSGGQPALTFTAKQGYGVIAAADVHDDAGDGAVALTLAYGTDSAGPTCRAGNGGAFPGGTTTCQHRTAHGQKVEISRTRYPTGAREFSVQVHRTDGTWAYLRAQSYSEAPATHGKNSSAPQPERATPPLTVTQAVAVAIDPTLYYHSQRTG